MTTNHRGFTNGLAASNHNKRRRESDLFDDDFDDSNNSFEDDEAYAAMEQLDSHSRFTKNNETATATVLSQTVVTDAAAIKDTSSNTSVSPQPKRLKNFESEHGIYRDRVPSGSIDCISMTSTETNEHVFVTLLPNEEDWMVSQTHHELEMELRDKESMLGTSIEQMMDNAEKNLLTMSGKNENKTLSMSSSRSILESNSGQSKLYVDKYTPKSFTDLLTNEQFNREVLRWVKEWDPIVFPDKQAANKPPAVVNKDSKQLIGPEQRIVLISGPPGIGKTTLAHIVAKQAGYRPVEINASDDRSSNRLMELITSYTQTQSMFGDKRPILLIIDEIDGLLNSETRSAISALLKLVYPPKKSSKTTPNEEKGNTKSTLKKPIKKKTQKRLNRPIICICNDHYAPVLRELRLRSKLFVFKRKETQDVHNIERLVNRISHICSQEGLSFSKRYIRDLAIKSDGDIRTCLNTIQFASSDKLENINLAEKDSRKDYFDIMTKIFDKRVDINPVETEKSEQRLTYISRILSDEIDRYDTLLMGCFENYPSVKYNSSINLRETVKALEWTSWSDKMNLVMRRTNAFALSSYALFSIAMYHLNCMSLYKQGFHKYNYPKKDGDVSRDREQRRNICRSMFSMEAKGPKDNQYATTSCTMYNHHPVRSSTDLQLDTIPQLVSMLYPNILIKTKSAHTNNLMYASDANTSLAANIKNVTERQAVENIISLCVDYGLSFRSNYENGSLKYELDPPIHRLVDFRSQNEEQDKKKMNTRETDKASDLPYTIKRIVSAEIHNEKLRKVAKKNAPQETKPVAKTSTDMAPPSPRTPPKMKSAFTTSPTSSPTVQTSSCSLYFSFHDGHTNAIRRPAKLRAFL